MKQELREAIEAGERALYSLREAQKALGSAKNWGMIDIFGGGLFTDLIKHGKMKDASGWMENARRDLHIFERELRDTDLTSELHLNMGDFLTVADYIFDGMVADILMHSRIAQTKEKVDEAIDRVTYLLATLQEAYAKMS